MVSHSRAKFLFINYMHFLLLKMNLLRKIARRFATMPDARESARMSQAQLSFNAGIEKWNNNDLNGAKQSFLQSIEEYATSDAYFNLASVYQSQGKHEKALEFWKKSLEFEDRSDAHSNIGSVLAIFNNDKQGSLPHYKRALELNPKDGEVAYNYAVVLDSLGKLDEAIKMYEKALALNVTQAEINLRNAKAKFSQGHQKNQ